MQRLLYFVVFGIAVPCASRSPAATVTVDLSGGADFTEIQPAIDAAKDGDTVLVKPGDYLVTAPIDFNRGRDPENPQAPAPKNITVKSEKGPAETTIRMSSVPTSGERASVVLFQNGEGASSTLEGFTLTGGRGTKWRAGSQQLGGGGILIRGGSKPTLKSCEISGNLTGWGGGALCVGAAPSLEGCTIAGNAADWSGGGMLCQEGASPLLVQCTLASNTASLGGAVACSGSSSPTIRNCTIAGNAASQGGGIHCLQSSPVLRECIVWDNAGGPLFQDAESHAVVARSCVEATPVWPGEGNIAADPLFCAWGAGRKEVWVDAAAAGSGDGSQGSPYRDLRSALAGYSLGLSPGSPCLGAGDGGANLGSKGVACDASGDPALLIHLAEGVYQAGGLSLAHRVSIRGVGAEKTTLQGTVAGLRKGAALSRVMVTRGTAGGVVVAAGEAPRIESCRISRNSGIWGAVSIWDGSTAVLAGCVVSDNSTLNGAVFCYRSSPALESCLISGNWSTFEPGTGGIHCWLNSSPILTNCEISGNHSKGPCALLCRERSSPSLRNCTVSGNESEWEAGAIYCEQGSSPTIMSSIVWAHAGPSIQAMDQSQPVVSHSCLEGTRVWPGEGNTNADPKFVKAGRWQDCVLPDGAGCVPYRFDAGGLPTAWHRLSADFHLQPGSSAIDGGLSEGAPAKDIEGAPRPCLEGVDMGAYEYGFCGSLFRRGDVDSNGELNITDPIFLLSYLFQSGEAPACLDSCDADDSGKLDITDGIYSLLYLFQGGAPPEPPFEECGFDASEDEIGCGFYEPCR